MQNCKACLIPYEEMVAETFCKKAQYCSQSCATRDQYMHRMVCDVCFNRASIDGGSDEARERERFAYIMELDESEMLPEAKEMIDNVLTSERDYQMSNAEIDNFIAAIYALFFHQKTPFVRIDTVLHRQFTVGFALFTAIHVLRRPSREDAHGGRLYAFASRMYTLSVGHSTAINANLRGISKEDVEIHNCRAFINKAYMAVVDFFKIKRHATTALMVLGKNTKDPLSAGDLLVAQKDVANLSERVLSIKGEFFVRPSDDIDEDTQFFFSSASDKIDQLIPKIKIMKDLTDQCMTAVHSHML